ncbi:hypothetical protein THASP1DRAFT_27471 [Thamnocephalis sphaerospora]|uniref:Uncharacterized protein n=1 Tax=Thamnocephalis sphaerospora TaxID=78915 RepID=A0A4P9XWL2_9FUNG|nr:hypothetical protein THASP1DRAFT_27471 [Thamnocephalis sphaerospora]|eukprot:RKP10765.1 hypothetical protein THASP1DRAFT_27471 [Thamnocephalis sphaerospora]
MASFMSGFASVRQKISARPILALSITNGLLAGVSDVLAQSIARSAHRNETDTAAAAQPRHGTSVTVADTGAVMSRRGHSQDKDIVEEEDMTANSLHYTRTARFAAYGVAIAPVIHHWYAFLDRSFPLPTASTTNGSRLSSRMLGQAVKRVLGDQIVFAPVGLAVFFSIMTVFENGGLAEIKAKLNEATNYMVWPAVQFVNFCFVPLMLRVPFVSGVSVFWNAYLSYLNSRRAANQEQLAVPLEA